MKKKLLFTLVGILGLLFMMPNAYAFDASNYRYHGVCGNFEIAGFREDGSVVEVGCFNTYEEARDQMIAYGGYDLGILAWVDGVPKIIDANVALLDLSVNPETLTYFYRNSELTGSAYTYMDTGSLYGGVDGVHMETAYSNYYDVWTAKVRIGNFTGWIRQSAYEIVPITWIKSTSTYTITNSDIRHNYVAKIQNYYNGSSGRTIGPKPEMLNPGTYYSYDGHYFYNNLILLIQDAKAGHYNNSVNKDNPYYNYYMYLSNHTKTNYSNVNINEYVKNNLNFSFDAYGKVAETGASRLHSSGDFFYYAQQKYGVNAILALSLSRNETGNGRSKLAVQKNNGFGLNAVDSNPIEGANWYSSFANSILGYASKWITYGYAHPRDWRYFGPQFGDKWIGMNVKYASDTYWSEKMAANYYSFDKAFGLQDYNFYQLGVVNGPTIAYAYPDPLSYKMYEYPEREDAVVIVGEITANGDTWYKVVSDLNFDNNFREITSGDYNWNAYVYVRTSEVRKINTGKNGYISPNEVFEYPNSNYQYDMLTENGILKPRVAISTKTTPYYFDSTLVSKGADSLQKDRYVMVYSIAYDKGVPVSYLVTSSYAFDQKAWVAADSIKFTNTNYGLVSISLDGNPYSWVNYNTDDASYSYISSLYHNTYVPILDTINDNGTIWYKVPVSLINNTNLYGYTLASANGVTIQTATPIVVNNMPTITTEDKTIIEGDSFDPKEGVSAYDMEDGDLTSKIEITENTVNANAPGTYQVTYRVVDSSSVESITRRTIIVKENKAPTITANNTTIYVGDSFNPKEGVSAIDSEDGDLTGSIVITKNEVNTKTPGSYKVVYEVADSRKKKATKERIITVKEKPQEMDPEEIDIESLEDLGLEEKESIFYFDSLKEENNQLMIKGYNAIKGMNNTLKEEIIYILAFESLNEESAYAFPIERITDKNEITRPVNSSDNYDYTYSWFKGEIPTKEIPDGDYKMYIFSVGEEYYSSSIISNKILKTQVSTFKGDKIVTTRNNYFDHDIPLEIMVRSKAIGEKTALSKYNQYNQYRALEFVNNQLHIKGTAYSYGMNLAESASVTRKIVFENTKTYEKYEFDLGSITNGMYEVGTTLGDNLDKTRAWFDANIDISKLSKGNYAIYIYNQANIKDYGELNELLQRNVSKVTTTIQGKKYSFEVDKSQRYRLELNVE